MNHDLSFGTKISIMFEKSWGMRLWIGTSTSKLLALAWLDGLVRSNMITCDTCTVHDRHNLSCTETMKDLVHLDQNMYGTVSLFLSTQYNSVNWGWEPFTILGVTVYVSFSYKYQFQNIDIWYFAYSVSHTFGHELLAKSTGMKKEIKFTILKVPDMNILKN